MPLHRGNIYGFAVLCAFVFLGQPVGAEPWPAEPVGQAVNLTAVEGTSGFNTNLSGAYWNEPKQELWLVRNGGPAKMWVMKECQPTQQNPSGWCVKSQNNVRGEWALPGDIEAVTVADDNSNIVYVMSEAEGRIHAYDVTTYGQNNLRRNYNISAFIPAYNGSAGPEGLAFVPDETLQAVGFTADSASGAPEVRTSRKGMGGLMFVGHQAGGSIYVFDLDPNSDTVNVNNYVGEYKTGYNETAEVTFDRSTGELLAWHDAGYDKLEVTDMRSARLGAKIYRFNSKHIYDGPNSDANPGPNNANNEGLAVRPISSCGQTGRQIFMTVDDGGANSLYQYKQFTPGCGPAPTCNTDSDCSGGRICDTATHSCYICPLDLNRTGVINALDVALLQSCKGGCYPRDHNCRSMNFDGGPNGCINAADETILGNATTLPTSSYNPVCATVKAALIRQFTTIPGRLSASPESLTPADAYSSGNSAGGSPVTTGGIGTVGNPNGAANVTPSTAGQSAAPASSAGTRRK